MTGAQRRTAALIAALLSLALAACTPEPAPTPTPTGFASEEEAFAAAEATYRAYVDAVNARRSDPASIPSPTDFLTGDAYNDEISTDEMLADRGWRIHGNTTVASVTPHEANATEVTVSFCLDASATKIVDATGLDVTPADRQEILGIDVTFAPRGAGLVVTDSSTSAATC